MPSYRDLLRDAKSRITEIQPEEAETRLGRATFLDVREQDEYDQGTIPGSVFIPRGHLESQAETRLANRDQPIVVYCAGGNRSAFAAETLEQLLLARFTDLGQEDVTAVAVALLRGERLRRDPRSPLVLPTAEATGHRHDVGEPELLERLGRERGAVATGAVDDDRLVAVEQAGLGLALEVAAGDEHRAGDGAGVVLVLLPHVEEGGVVEAGLRGLGVDLADV